MLVLAACRKTALFTIEGSFTFTGTRNGNSATLTGTDGGGSLRTLDFAGTSNPDFEGDGLVEDGREYIAFETRGYSSPLLAGE